MLNSSSSLEPDRPLVSSIPAVAPCDEYLHPLVGRNMALIPLQESHAEDLYHNIGGVQNAHLYKYVPGGPLTDFESFAAFMKPLYNRSVTFTYAVSSKAAPGQVEPGSSRERANILTGIVSQMNIHPSNRCIEIGVLFGSQLQRTTAATEACFLLLKLCFEHWHFLRVEWKTNNLNEPSKKSALRLGFVAEGVFRKHMVLAGRRRDTAWFSMIDEDWEGGAREALEQWLRDDNFDRQRRQKARLEEIRARILDEKA